MQGRLNDRTGNLIKPSLMGDIIQDFNNYWAYDKLNVFINNNSNDKSDHDTMPLLPYKIKSEILLDYLYYDLLNQSQFLKCVSKRVQVLIASGLMPRRFYSDNENDRILLFDNEVVSEMYFTEDCDIGIAIPHHT